MIKYEASVSCYATIEKIEVLRETEKCVFIETRYGEDKRLKDNSWRPIFDTWELAHNWIVSKAIEKVESAQKQLSYAEEDYNKAINMEEAK
ncbi:MAG: hypothetical protein A2Y62_21190 [Candidatus Fischerbacteria bacterium RBG_13_37_8]|uniref:Uncharacterized protein n=1 Tax=Candidatus Fischerbacteria bacterium RBG_13_37_8 TaxID=1817863 RepID=A0A1F5V5B4_9BACT|nr:MAG: hypothetical protein A2Y62_21190 [Candidatus Fischerbacteria bacterium RBG_13_37_8]